MPESITQTRFLGVNWRGGLLGGLVGGLLWLLIMMATAPLVGISVWAPLQYIAALVLGANAALVNATFSWNVLAAGLFLHLFLSVLYTFVLGAYIRFHPIANATFAGLIYGLILYILNFHLFGPAYPWFGALLHPGTIFAHMVFGMAAAWVYIRVEQATDPIPPPQSEEPRFF
ncbi:MAG: hypothetical protein H0U74_06545 [Bradymonadaceae bacterium]|nr:hypothetical protein [Lujinxingiaceae bacterium]